MFFKQCIFFKFAKNLSFQTDQFPKIFKMFNKNQAFNSFKKKKKKKKNIIFKIFNKKSSKLPKNIKK